MYQHYVALLPARRGGKRVTGFTPLQFFSQSTTKDDRSQFPKFFLPLLGFTKKEIDLGIPIVHLPYIVWFAVIGPGIPCCLALKLRFRAVFDPCLLKTGLLRLQHAQEFG